MPLSISHLDQCFNQFNCIPDKSRTLYDEVVLVGLTRFRTASLLTTKNLLQQTQAMLGVCAARLLCKRLTLNAYLLRPRGGV
jgi:hypothetical protein